MTLRRDPLSPVARSCTQTDERTCVEFLRSVFLFHEWTEESLRKLAAVMTTTRFPPQTTVVRQGGQSHSIFFIRSGRCRVVKWIPRTQRDTPTQSAQQAAAVAIAADLSAAAIAAENDSFTRHRDGSSPANGSRPDTPTSSFEKRVERADKRSAVGSFVLARPAADGWVGRAAVDGRPSSPRVRGVSSNGDDSDAGDDVQNEDPSGLPVPAVLTQLRRADEASAPRDGEEEASGVEPGVEPVEVCELEASQVALARALPNVSFGGASPCVL